MYYVQQQSHGTAIVKSVKMNILYENTRGKKKERLLNVKRHNDEVNTFVFIFLGTYTCIRVSDNIIQQRKRGPYFIK